MPGSLFALPKTAPISDGAVVPGAKIYFYQTGTTTPQNIYSDIDLETAHANPVEADADGVFAPIYLDGSLPAYRVKLTDSSDTLIYQVDDVPSSQKTVADQFTVTGGSPYIDLIEDDASTNSGAFRIQVTGDTLYVYLANDALSVFTEALSITRSGTTLSAVNVGGEPIFASGSFSGTQTGYATDLTPTVQWRRSVDTVWLSINAGSTGTSNATSMTLKTLPSSIRPATALTVPCRIEDSGTIALGVASIGTNGVITFGSDGAGSAFTNSGTKGLPGGWSLVYDRLRS